MYIYVYMCFEELYERYGEEEAEAIIQQKDMSRLLRLLIVQCRYTNPELAGEPGRLCDGQSRRPQQEGYTLAGTCIVLHLEF